MNETPRPLLEEAMLASPRHSGYVEEKPDEPYPVLRKKDHWSFARKGIHFVHRGLDLTGYYDFDCLFFDEPDPDNRQSPDNLLVGQLTLPYSVSSDIAFAIPVPEEPTEADKRLALGKLVAALDEREHKGKVIPTLIFTEVDIIDEDYFKETLGFHEYTHVIYTPAVELVTATLPLPLGMPLARACHCPWACHWRGPATALGHAIGEGLPLPPIR
jgi:hypothetical protein